MMHCTRLTAALGFALCLPVAASGQPRSAKSNINDLSMEVSALQLLRYFRFTPDQMKRLQKTASETIDKESAARSAAKVSEEYRKTLTSLRQALVSADDDDRILELEQELDDLREKEQPNLDDGIDITDAARTKAPEVLRTLYAGQVAAYLNTYGEDIPDPTETLLDALATARGLKEEEWKAVREEIREQVGRLAAGLDADKATRTSNEAVQFLIRVRLIKNEKEFQAHRGALEKEARQIVGDVSPIDVLRNIAEIGLAELLSNPWLERALSARLKAAALGAK